MKTSSIIFVFSLLMNSAFPRPITTNVKPRSDSYTNSRLARIFYSLPLSWVPTFLGMDSKTASTASLVLTFLQSETAKPFVDEVLGAFFDTTKESESGPNDGVVYDDEAWTTETYSTTESSERTSEESSGSLLGAWGFLETAAALLGQASYPETVTTTLRPDIASGGSLRKPITGSSVDRTRTFSRSATSKRDPTSKFSPNHGRSSLDDDLEVTTNTVEATTSNKFWGTTEKARTTEIAESPEATTSGHSMTNSDTFDETASQTSGTTPIEVLTTYNPPTTNFESREDLADSQAVETSTEKSTILHDIAETSELTTESIPSGSESSSFSFGSMLPSFIDFLPSLPFTSSVNGSSVAQEGGRKSHSTASSPLSTTKVTMAEMTTRSPSELPTIPPVMKDENGEISIFDDEDQKHFNEKQSPESSQSAVAPLIWDAIKLFL